MSTMVIFISGLFSAIIIDQLWIGVLFANFYKKSLGALGRITDGKFTPNLPAGFLVYVFIVLGIVVFILPRVADGKQAFLYGALLGLVIGGVYDMTNYSVLKLWDLKFSMLDIFWTSISVGVVSTVMYWVKYFLIK